MKAKLLYALSLLLSLGGIQEVSAQCGTCSPDVSCYQPGGTQCPPSGQAPPMYLNNPYSTVVTFDMPPDTNVSPIGVVEIVNVQYASITGLPIGISWSCNSQANGCQYNPDAGETKACITFCGTPLSPPGNYTVTINIYGTASTPIGNQTQYQPIEYMFTILPDTGSNGYFSLSPSFGCDSISVDLDAVYDLPLPNLVSYDWDFDNGNTATGANPPAQVYDTPGQYYPTLTTHVYNLVVKKVTTTASGNFWCGDVEEPNWPIVGCTAAPDLYFRLQHGSSTYTSSSTSDNNAGTWDNLGITMESALLTLSVWDDDGTSPDDDGGFTVISVTGPGTYTYTTNSPFGGGTFGSVEVIQVLANDIITTDTVTVFELPALADLLVSPSDTVCEKQFITLTAPQGNYVYEWYKDGAFLSDTLGSSITITNESGIYNVNLVDINTGCNAFMNPATIYFKPGVYNTTASYNAGLLMANPSSGFTYQWIFNGLPVFPGGTSSTYTPEAVGVYACILTNGFGCSDTTTFANVTSLAGIAESTDISGMVNVFPNPAEDRITIQYSAGLDCKADIRILNQLGAVVQNQRVTCTAGSQFEISVADLAPGMYYLEFKTEAGFAAKRFIKK